MLEKMKLHEQGAIEFEIFEQASTKMVNIKYQCEESYQNYKHEIEAYNSEIERAVTDYNPHLRKLEQCEDRRINFIKFTIDRFFQTYDSFGQAFASNETKLKDAVHCIDSKTDTQIFVDLHRSHSGMLTPLSVVTYEERRREESDEEDPLLLSVNKEEYYFAKDKLGGLLKVNEEISDEDTGKIRETLHSCEIVAKLSEQFKFITTPKQIKSKQMMDNLSSLVKQMITQSLNDKHNDYKVIHSILTASHNIYTKQERLKKLYLTDLIADHPIWQEVSKWKYWMYRVIEDRRKDVLDRKKRAIKLKIKREEESKKKNEEEVAPRGGFFGKIMSAVATPINQIGSEIKIKEEIMKIEQNEKADLNVIFNVLTQFQYHLTHF